VNELAKKLRALAEEHYEMLGNIHDPLTEAANEIERLETTLREENKRMRDALVAILRTGPIDGTIGGPGLSYKALHIMHLREAVKALGLSKIYPAAWEQVIERGWAEK
jgi:hypothetical protein